MAVRKRAKRKKPITQRNACDRMFSEIVRSVGRCENCGRLEDLQCAHVISRRYAWTRTDRANAYCLCAACHMRFHANPDEWIDFVTDTIGRDAFDRLKQKAHAGVNVKFNWFDERERLKQVHAEVFA